MNEDRDGKNYRYVTTTEPKSLRYRQAYPSAPAARASYHSTSSQDPDRVFEVPAPVPGMEPWVIVPVEGYEIRRNLDGNSDKLTTWGGISGREGCFLTLST